MEFFKKLFSKEQPKQPQFIEDLQAVQALVLPSFDPQQYEFKVNLFKTAIKFRTPATISLKQMRAQSALKTVEITKQTARYTWWRASYAEFQALYQDPTIEFMQTEVQQVIDKLQQIDGPVETLESIIEYEPSVQNILSVLRDAKNAQGVIDEEILYQSMHLLKRIVYEVEIEIHQKHVAGKRALIDQLKFEEKYMNRHED